MTRNLALELRGVTRSFGGVVAVHDVDLDLPPGARRALLGPNGAGKTTLVNLVAGVMPPTSGSITAFGADVTRESARRRISRGVVRTYQKSKIFGGMSVLDNIELAVLGRDARSVPAWFSKRRASVRRDKARALADRVGLDDHVHELAGSLSHGGKRQLELAMALAADPRLLILDEPAAGLSPSERQMLSHLLSELPEDLAVLLIEHDMNIALRFADHVTVMADGEVVFEGTPGELTASSAVHDIYLGKSHA